MLDIYIDWLDDNGNKVDRTKLEYDQDSGPDITGNVHGSQFRLHVDPGTRQLVDPPQSFAEHTAEALALVDDRVRRPEGATCSSCGHEHQGERWGYICIGCPCTETEARDG
jgi:hypothetical protein